MLCILRNLHSTRYTFRLTAYFTYKSIFSTSFGLLKLTQICWKNLHFYNFTLTQQISSHTSELQAPSYIFLHINIYLLGNFWLNFFSLTLSRPHAHKSTRRWVTHTVVSMAWMSGFSSHTFTDGTVFYTADSFSTKQTFNLCCAVVSYLLRWCDRLVSPLWRLFTT